jgi:glycosyltransferase involved in cell wall biosynthesis
MKILMLAPHPFYQERGSPIAVGMLLQALSERGDTVHVLVYHEGDDFELPNVELHRAPAPWFVHQVPPGFSWKKVLCDISMFFSALRLAFRGGFDLVYAVEEASFIALPLNWFGRIPYVYDMDSRLSEQLSEKSRFFSVIKPLLRFLERIAIRNACMIVPVCDGLVTAKDLKGREAILLRDVSLLNPVDDSQLADTMDDLRSEMRPEATQMLMYVGNLQTYQGIDLLIDSFAIVAGQRDDVDLVVIGGSPEDVDHYRDYARRAGVESQVHFLGPRPVKHLAQYLAQSDVLVSPRIKGTNTPMKVYSYLHSGTACLLTDLLTHNQVASDDIAVLADPDAAAFANGMLRLVNDEKLRDKLGAAARRYVEEHHSADAFSRTANELFDRVERSLHSGRSGQ